MVLAEEEKNPGTVLYKGKYVSNKKPNRPYMKKTHWDSDDIARFEKEKAERASQPYPLEWLWKPLSSIFVNVGKWLSIGIFASLVLSMMITDSWTWGYRGKWTNIHTYFPATQHNFTLEQLSQYRGQTPDTPLYLAIKGDVFDVSKNRRIYGPGGGYHFFAGTDASRAYVTGCFKTHLTHDVRGLTEKELKTIDNWHSFFSNHAEYHKVGTVNFPPIDPDSPIPEDCNVKKEGRS